MNTLQNKNRIALGAMLLAASSVGSYIFGLLRDRLLAGKFGAGAELDVYNAAFVVPDLIMTLFAAALTTAVIPILTKERHTHNAKQVWAITNHLLYLISACMIVAILLAGLFMPWLAKLIVPGFDADRLGLFIQISRIMLLSPLLFSMSIIFGGTLQSMQRFISYALSPILYNAGIVISIILLHDRFGIFAAVYGVLIGGGLHLLIRLLELKTTGWSLKYKPHDTWPAVKSTIRLMLPRIGGLVLVQLNLWIYIALGSTLAIGSISIFNLARNFQSLPVSLFGIALATAIFPSLAAQHIKAELKIFGEQLNNAISHILFFTLPACVGMMLIAEPLVETFLGNGEFTTTAIQNTSWVLTFFALSIPLESIQHILARAFYARHDTLTPLFIGIAATIVNGIVSSVAIQWLGVAGLACGFVAMTATYVGLMFYYLQRSLTNIWDYKIIKRLSIMLLLSCMMGILVWLTLHLHLSTLLKLGIATTVGATVYLGCAKLFKLPELQSVTLLFYKILRKSPHEKMVD